jgi:hypothetical protein
MATGACVAIADRAGLLMGIASGGGANRVIGRGSAEAALTRDAKRLSWDLNWKVDISQ